MQLVWPAREYLPAYTAALERGWSPDNIRGTAAAREQLARIEADPDGFLASLVDRDARGAAIVLGDGSAVPRLPGYVRWMWDGEFCGTIGFRWQPGTEALPPHCLGHIGYSVVPWKRRQGYASRALAAVLGDAAAEGLRYVEISTGVENTASQRVVEANGGVVVREFVTLPSLGRRRELLYRIHFGDGERPAAFRPFQPAADLDACLEMFDANCPESFAPNERSDYLEFLAAHAAAYTVCLVDGRPVGAYGLTPHADGMALRWILLSPERQRAGLGSRLMTRLFAELRDLGMPPLYIAASHKSAPFFARFGAVERERIANGWGPGMDRVNMSLRREPAVYR